MESSIVVFIEERLLVLFMCVRLFVLFIRERLFLVFTKERLFVLSKCTCKSKGHPITGHQGPRGGVEVELYSFSTSAVGGGGWSAPRPGRFTPGKYPVPIVQEAGCAPGPVWTCAKNLAPTGIRSSDGPARTSRYTD
jgi:hypothetical protein